MATYISLKSFFLFMFISVYPYCTTSNTRINTALEEAEADRVTNLPGQPPAKFRHYSGYIKLGRHSHSKALFYWFFQAQHDAPHKPLGLDALPSLSVQHRSLDHSLLLITALHLCPTTTLGTKVYISSIFNTMPGICSCEFITVNVDYVVANMLFLESPVGVGFSYTNNSAELQKLGDKVTADDSYDFLINWFKRFPAFKSHDFYLAGESYAGHYVPQLADLIYERNKAAPTTKSYINLKGFMIGNAVINDETDALGMVDFAWNHGIISDQLHRNVKQCFTNENRRRGNRERSQSSISSSSGGTAEEEIMMNCSGHLNGFAKAYSGIDIYSIYTPLCNLPNSNATQRSAFPKFILSNNINIPTFIKDVWHKLPSGYDPCTERYAEKYFNREDVQKALHANLTRLSYPYQTCSSVIGKWNDSQDTVLPIIRKLMEAGLRIWIYSGDTDGRVPVTSTRYSVNSMELEVEEEWRAWFNNGQVGGWVETYKGGMVLATVRGAGHQVPVLAPQQSLSLFSHFLSATSLPSSPSHES
ncbi:Serine carboxypeptidase-like 35 [Linum perenne]